MVGPGEHFVTDRVIGDVQAGRLAPGTWLKPIDLQLRYGCRGGEAGAAPLTLPPRPPEIEADQRDTDPHQPGR